MGKASGNKPKRTLVSVGNSQNNQSQGSAVVVDPSQSNRVSPEEPSGSTGNSVKDEKQTPEETRENCQRLRPNSSPSNGRDSSSLKSAISDITTSTAGRSKINSNPNSFQEELRLRAKLRMTDESGEPGDPPNPPPVSNPKRVVLLWDGPDGDGEEESGCHAQPCMEISLHRHADPIHPSTSPIPENDESSEDSSTYDTIQKETEDIVSHPPREEEMDLFQQSLGGFGQNYSNLMKNKTKMYDAVETEGWEGDAALEGTESDYSEYDHVGDLLGNKRTLKSDSSSILSVDRGSKGSGPPKFEKLTPYKMPEKEKEDKGGENGERSRGGIADGAMDTMNKDSQSSGMITNIISNMSDRERANHDDGEEGPGDTAVNSAQEEDKESHEITKPDGMEATSILAKEDKEIRDKKVDGSVSENPVDDDDVKIGATAILENKKREASFRVSMDSDDDERKKNESEGLLDSFKSLEDVDLTSNVTLKDPSQQHRNSNEIEEEKTPLVSASKYTGCKEGHKEHEHDLECGEINKEYQEEKKEEVHVAVSHFHAKEIPPKKSRSKLRYGLISMFAVVAAASVGASMHYMKNSPPTGVPGGGGDKTSPDNEREGVPTAINATFSPIASPTLSPAPSLYTDGTYNETYNATLTPVELISGGLISAEAPENLLHIQNNIVVYEALSTNSSFNISWTEKRALKGSSVAISYNGTRIAIGAFGTNITIYDTTTDDSWNITVDGESTDSEEPILYNPVFALSGDGNRFVLCKSGRIHIFDFVFGSDRWDEFESTIPFEIQNFTEGKNVSKVSLSLSEDGSRIAIGTPYSPTYGVKSGDVSVWSQTTVNNTLVWEPLIIMKLNQLITPGSEFGNSVSISANGNILAAGAWLSSTNDGVNVGCVFVFEEEGGRFKNKKMILSGTDEGEKMGTSLSLSANGTRLAIGGEGDVKVFEKRDDWEQLGWKRTGEPLQNLGSSLHLSGMGNRIAVASKYTEGLLMGSLVQIFDISDDAGWAQVGEDIIWKMTIAEEVVVDFGSVVAMSYDGNQVLIGTTDALNTMGVVGRI